MLDEKNKPRPAALNKNGAKFSRMALDVMHEAPTGDNGHLSLLTITIKAAVRQAYHCDLIVGVHDYQPVFLTGHYQCAWFPSRFGVFSAAIGVKRCLDRQAPVLEHLKARRLPRLLRLD